MELTPVIEAIAVTGVVAGIVSAGAVKMGPNVAKSAVNKLVGMFR
jgi:hypothetical protein